MVAVIDTTLITQTEKDKQMSTTTQQTNSTTNSISNVSKFGAVVLQLAVAAGKVKTGPLCLAAQFRGELLSLSTKPLAEGTSARSAMLAYWHEATPEGAKHEVEYNKLVALKDTKTKTQAERQAAMLAENNAVVSCMTRAVDVCRGIVKLEAVDCRVTLEDVGKGKYSAFVRRNVDGADGESIPFTMKHLIGAAGGAFSKTTSVLNIRKACSSAKLDTPNGDKGSNGERIAPSKIASAVENLDTSLAAYFEDATGKFAVGKNARKALRAFWARIDSTMTDEERATARAEFAADGAADGVAAAEVAAA